MTEKQAGERVRYSARRDMHICGVYRINKRWFVYVWFRGMCEVPLWVACVWAALAGVGLGCLIVWVGEGLVNLLLQLSEVKS